MELILPNQIALNDNSLAMIADVEEAARRIDDRRPLPDAIVRRLDGSLLGERVYSSNAIEGNTLELRETVMILEKGIAGFKKKREALEAKNLGEAVRMVSAWVADSAQSHTREDILAVHRTILDSLDEEWAGRFREHRVVITAATYQPPDHAVVEALVDRVMKTLSTPVQGDALLRAVWAHWALARIHPFHDGNGRIARLWQDFVLLQNGLTCAVIRPEDRRRYLEALTGADEGDFNPLVQLVAQRVASTFDRYLIELRKEDELDEWVADVAGEADARVGEKRELAYVKWKRHMEQLRREFEYCAAKISEGSRKINVQVREFEFIEQPNWENIRSGVGGEKTWFFTVELAHVQRRCRYCFFFEKHYWGDLDNEAERSQPHVGLVVSEDDGQGRFVRLDQIARCPLTFREVFLPGDTFVRRRAIEDGHEEYDREISALRIAQDFLREVVLRGLT